MRLATLRRSGSVRGAGVVVGPRPLDTCAAEWLLCWEPCYKTGRVKSERQYHLLNSVHESANAGCGLPFWSSQIPLSSALQSLQCEEEVRASVLGCELVF